MVQLWYRPLEDCFMTKLAAALALTIPALAYAQSQDSKTSVSQGAAVAPVKATGAPTKASVPTGHVYQGGFQQPIYPTGFRQFSRTGWMHPIYPNGFARIMPLGLPKIPKDAIGHTKADIAAGDPKRFLKQGDTPDTTPVSRQPMPEPGPAIRSGPSFKDNRAPAPAPAPMTAPTPIRTPLDAAAALRALQQPPPVQEEARKCNHNRAEGIVEADMRRQIRINERRGHEPTGNEHTYDHTREFGLGMDTAHQPVTAVGPDSSHATQDADAFADPDVVGREPARAVDLLRAHVAANPEDFRAARMLSIALLMTKHAQDAAETMAKAYESDPLLCKEPIDTKQMGLDTARVNNLVKTAGDAARQSNSAKAWLLATSLYQAQGTQPLALSSLEKARKAGLNPDVSDWFAAELKKPAPQVTAATTKP
jgi:hypothetical protein